MDASSELRVGGLTLAADSELARGVVERRLESRLGVTPVPEVHLAVGVPVLYRSLTLAEARLDSTQLGDVEISGAFRLLEAAGALTHRVWLTPFVKLPTAAVQLDPSGEALPSNLQPGCSSVVPSVGAQYVFEQRSWQVALSGGVMLPFVIRDAPHRGALTSLAAPTSLTAWQPLRVTVGMKWLLEATGDDGSGNSEPNSGGLIGYAAAGVDVDVRGYFSAGAGIDVPLVQALLGEQEPTPIVSLRISGSWDLTRITSSTPASTVIAERTAPWL